MSQGKVYLVGAGPGDFELITLKGYRLICQADVILYDRLIPPELPQLAKPTAEVIPVGKTAGRHPVPQQEINALLVEKAKSNKIVVRLKGGDPYLFGRGGEEAEACVQAGVDFEVVPGVTSAIAAACYAGIPPTHRDYTSSVAIVTGHRKDREEIEIPKAGTVIFLMSVSNLHKIVSSLLKAGFSKKTKMAAVERGSFYDQKVIIGVLEDFIETAQKANLRPPAVFIVGEVVQLREKLDWYGKQPTVLVLGNHPEKYNHLGTIVHRRIIDCVALEDYSDADAVLKEAGTFDWIVFTSVNGAKFFFERLRSFGADARLLASTKIAAIGRTTGRRLSEYGILPDMTPQTESSAGLLEEFNGMDLNGKKVLLPRAKGSSEELPEGLHKAGANVKTVVVYKTVEIDPGQINFEYIDRILFTSGSTVRAFVNKFGTVPPHIKVYCLGPPTLAVAGKHNIQAEVLPAESNKGNGS